MPREYVSARFSPGDRQTYTFHNDGEPVSVGDTVEVETRSGIRKAMVEGVATEPPRFPTKPVRAILKRAAEGGAPE